MKVFLIQDVPSLGRKGETKEVSDGYARNFLLRHKLAVLPNDVQAQNVMSEKIQTQTQEKVLKKDLSEKLAQLNGQTFVFQAKADKNGHLYGSIGPKELSKAIGLDQSVINEHFKTLGEFSLNIKLHDETAKVKIVIEREK